MCIVCNSLDASGQLLQPQEEPSQREGQGFKPANSTIVVSEDMTGRPEPYCGYSGALDVSGLLTDSLPGGGADDAAV
jgi:hypothetical protein